MGLWIDKRTRDDILYWDIRMTKGDSAYIRVKLKDLQDQELVPSEGDIIRAQIRTTQGQLVYSGTAESVNDQILWHIVPSDTKSLPAGKYVWDMQLEPFNSGDVFTFIPESTFEILGEVTK